MFHARKSRKIDDFYTYLIIFRMAISTLAISKSDHKDAITKKSDYGENLQNEISIIFSFKLKR